MFNQIIYKTYNTEFGEMIIKFTDQNGRPLEIEDKVNYLKNNHKNVFDSMNNVEICRGKNVKEKFYAQKNPIYIWDVNIDNLIISK